MKLAALAALLAAPVLHAQPTPSGVPAPLQPFYDRAAAECRAISHSQHGRLSLDQSVWTVRRVDLNSDGKPDYILNRAALVCDAAITLFCGTGGCGYDFAVSPPGGYRQQELQGRELTIGSGRIPVLEFSVHGEECNREGAYDCHWQWRWNGKRLAPYRRPA